MTINVNGRFLTQRVTGAQRYAREVARRLISARDVEGIRLLMPRHKEPVEGEFSRVAKQIGQLQGHFWEQLELGRWANRSGGVLWSPVNVGPVNARRHVVTIHDVFSIQFPQWFGKSFHLWYSFLLPRLALSACRILTVSEYSKENIVVTLNVPEDKVSVIYPGVNVNFVTAEQGEIAQVRETYNLPKDFILTVGSLEPRKNLERVVNAWLQLKGTPPSLVIIGGLGAHKVYGKYNTEGLRRHRDVRLLGYVPEEDLAPLYSAATVFVYASLLEGFGFPPLEALACGATVVTSNTSAMKEVNSETAFLVDPKSSEDIAKGITQALYAERTFTNRRLQSQIIKEKFDWAGTANQVEAILKQYE